MRFENKHFLIVIERKKTDKTEKAESENAVRGTSLKRWFPYAICGSALVVMIAVVCGLAFSNANRKNIDSLSAKDESIGNVDADITENVVEELFLNDELPEGSYVTSAHLASSVREKYQDETPYGYTYGEPIKGLKRDESIELQLGYDLDASDIEYWYELVAFYQEPELIHTITPLCSYDPETQKVTINPTNYPVGKLSVGMLSTEQVTKYDHSANYFFDKDSGTDWGNLGTMYMAIYKDLETGEDLKTPIVQIVTLCGEIEEKPVISFSINEDGRAALSWDPVEGADEYFICRIDKLTEHGLSGSAWPIDVTDGTSWVYEAPDFDSFSSTNEEFKYFDMSEDDWYDEYASQRAQEKYGITEGVYKDTSFYQDEEICVIAVNQNGTSMASNFISVSEIAANLPYRMAYDTSVANGFSSIGYLSIDEVSAYGYVTMCDGYTVPKVIDYQTEKAQIVVEHYVETDDEGNFTGSVDLPTLKIPYIIEGTPFEYVVEVQDYDEGNLEKDLAFLDEREEKLRKKSGDIGVTNNLEIDEQAETVSEEELSELQVREVTDVKITANCALSEYLAMNMLGGATLIDLSEFPEANDPAFVDDAWREAYYQNPLILGVKGYRLNKNGSAMRVVYDENAVVTAAKQDELLAVIPQIIQKIITDDMTELEKELAINQYLCDTIVYDEDALANAEKNNYLYVDDEFLDSFTAYGALINKKCVCAGYASAFKLLAEEVGLESVVVTGILEGSLSHAWNKVKIDGEWQILDVTNNDNEYLFNALLNLPDYAGDRVLVEDKDYALDIALSNYDSVQEENEYYRINDRYFPYEEVTNQLVEELTANGKTVLRTDYELNDEMFYKITDGIFEQMGEDIDLYGFYWMGVIYLSLSE